MFILIISVYSFSFWCIRQITFETVSCINYHCCSCEMKTYVSSFLTNYLFGKGQDWKGKKFYAGKERLGINRFQSKKDISRGKLQHNFNYEITPSNLAKGKVKSLRLTYVISQNFPSLWSTMNDELRFLRVPSKTGNSCHGILIGIGSMAWSGGVWNGSPFCLWNRSDI